MGPRRRRAGARCNPAHIRQVRGGGCLLRGVHPLVHSRYAFRRACRTQAIWQFWPVPALLVRAAVRPHTRPRGSGCPQLQPVRCDELMAVSLHSPQSSRTPRGARSRRPTTGSDATPGTVGSLLPRMTHIPFHPNAEREHPQSNFGTLLANTGSTVTGRFGGRGSRYSDPGQRVSRVL